MLSPPAGVDIGVRAGITAPAAPSDESEMGDVCVPPAPNGFAPVPAPPWPSPEGVGVWLAPLTVVGRMRPDGVEEFDESEIGDW